METWIVIGIFLNAVPGFIIVWQQGILANRTIKRLQDIISAHESTIAMQSKDIHAMVRASLNAKADAQLSGSGGKS